MKGNGHPPSALVLRVIAGDLLSVSCDAIVNPSNTALWLGMGVSGSIRDKAGPAVQREMLDHGYLAHGEGVVTGCGALSNCRAIIHAAVMDARSAEVKIRESTLNALLVANARGFTSIAFPAIGTGVGGVVPGRAAKEMLLGVQDFLARVWEPSIRVVQFVLRDAPNFRAFQTCVEIVQSGARIEEIQIGGGSTP